MHAHRSKAQTTFESILTLIVGVLPFGGLVSKVVHTLLWLCANDCAVVIANSWLIVEFILILYRCCERVRLSVQEMVGYDLLCSHAIQLICMLWLIISSGGDTRDLYGRSPE